MPSVALSDHLYFKAEQAAKTSGLSLEEFVARTIEASVEETPLRLTPEQTAMVRKGLADVAAGRVHSLDEVESRLAERKQVWHLESRG